MYENDENSTGIEAFKDAGAKVRKAKGIYNDVKYIQEKGAAIVNKLDQFVVDEALKKSYDFSVDNKSVDIKANLKSITKFSVNSIAKGTLRVNGKLIDSFYDKNDDNTVGVNAILDARARARNTIKTARNTVDTVKASYKAYKNVVDITKKTVSLLAKFIASNPIVFIFLIIVVILIALSSGLNEDDDMIAMFSGMGTEIVVTDDDEVDKYKTLVKKLDSELANQISAKGSYDDIVISGDKIDTSLKEILAILAVIKEQDIEYNSTNREEVKNIYDKVYIINKNTSTYYCSDQKCRGHDRLIVVVKKCSFVELLEKFNFDDDQKEWAENLKNADYSDIFKNLE